MIIILWLGKTNKEELYLLGDAFMLQDQLNNVLY
jgi:hypothetical protein